MSSRDPDEADRDQPNFKYARKVTDSNELGQIPVFGPDYGNSGEHRTVGERKKYKDPRPTILSMTLIFDDTTEENSDEDTVAEEIDFDSMSSEEFFDDLLKDAAAKLGVSVEELEEMDMTDIDEMLGTEIQKPYHPRGAREGYRDSDRLKTVSKDELEHRKEVVEEKLNL